MESLWQDLRYSVRRLVKSPGFTIVAVMTLGLGIGATTAIFSVVHAVLLRELPYEQPDRLVRLYETAGSKQRTTLSPPNFMDFRARADLFEGAAAMRVGNPTLTGGDEAERVPTSYVTGDFFSVLRARPAVGRLLRPEDAEAGQEKVVVLGHDFWQRRFGGTLEVVGTTLRLDGESYTVVGVAPRGFAYPTESDIWTPLVFTPRDLITQRGAHYLDAIARLQPGVTPQQADTELRAVARQLEEQYAESNRGYGASVITLREAHAGSVRPALLVMFGAVGLVLLIACVNIANLLLARAIGRERELAVRTALGATRARLLREQLAESLVLAFAGAAAGLLLALWSIDVLSRLQLPGIPILEDIRIDAPVLAFAALLAVLTSVVFGLLPALQASRIRELSQRLKEGTRGGGAGRQRARLRGALVVGEMALAMILLAGAGLLLRSFLEIRRVEPGFEPAGVLTFNLRLPDAEYDEPERIERFYAELLERVKTLPGVERAGAIFGLPLTGHSYTISISALDGVPFPPQADAPSTGVRIVTPEYFPAMGIPVERGRHFEPTDRAGTPRVVLVNAAAARLLWPGEDPIGRRLTLGTRFGQAERVGGQVVGVVGDVKHDDLRAAALPEVYLAHAQVPESYMTMVIRSSERPQLLVPGIRAHLRAIDRNVPMYDLRTMEERVSASVAQPRFYMTLLAVFAAVALVLAAIGIYGVIAYTVTQRTREIGVRIALGARGSDVVGLIVRDGMVLAGAGVVIGLAGSFVATRSIQGLLYGLETTDPATFGVVALLLLGVSLLACSLPARRATQVEPVVALHSE